MQLIEVNTPVLEKAFLEVPVAIYKEDPKWIRPLDKDIEAVFDRQKNKAYRKGGDSVRWLLQSAGGQNIGRVAAFVNPKYKAEQPTGGLGFFECIEDAAAAKILFDAAGSWLTERNMEAMDGPVNFGERDRWWGLQVAGFSEPLYCMNYNPPYYQKLFEDYGFQTYFQQICFALNPDKPLQEKFYNRHAEISKDPKYSADYVRKGKLEKAAADFATVYNAAWAGHGGGKTMEYKAVLQMFKNMKPVMQEGLIWFAYYEEEPVAMWVNLPDLNQWFKHLNGKFGLLQKLLFLYHKKFTHCNRFVGLVFGIVPAFQGKGIDSYLIVEAEKAIRERYDYHAYEMQWIGDFNPKMINVAENLGTYRSRVLNTYRYLFDRQQEFKRHPMLG